MKILSVMSAFLCAAMLSACSSTPTTEADHIRERKMNRIADRMGASLDSSATDTVSR